MTWHRIIGRTNNNSKHMQYFLIIHSVHMQLIVLSLHNHPNMKTTVVAFLHRSDGPI